MPTSAPTGEIWLGRWPSNRVGVNTNDTSTITLVPGTTRTYKIRSSTPHFRRPDNNVEVTGVRVDPPTDPPTANAFNGNFSIDSIISPTELTYTLTNDPEGAINWNASYVFIGAGDHQAITADAGTGAVVEGNFVCNVANGVYHDTWTTKDLTIRNNHFHRVRFGIHENLGAFNYIILAGMASTAQQPNPTRGGPDGRTATFRTTQPHGFLPGQGVGITDVKVGGSTSNPFNGDFSIVAVSSDEFTYRMNSDPGADADADLTAYYQEKFQVRRLTIENNIIDLSLNIHPRFYGPPTGIRFDATNYGEVYALLQVVIRNNRVQHADNAVELPNIARAVFVGGCENLLIEGNVIALNTTDPILFGDSKIVECFDNSTPSGFPLVARHVTSGKQVDDLTGRIEDTVLLCL